MLDHIREAFNRLPPLPLTAGFVIGTAIAVAVILLIGA